MSFYSFAAANLTTRADLKRRPAVNRGQVTRTMILCVLFLVALLLIARRSDAGDMVPSPAPTAAVTLPGCASSAPCSSGNAIDSPADEGTTDE